MMTQQPISRTPRPEKSLPHWLKVALGAPRQAVMAAILILALLAFELFNFDTTKYALHDLLGEVNFLGLSWAGVLAFAFCAIDFAGLVRIFTPQTGRSEPREVWYLMGAWLLGATMNAMMTWYAVALTLANRPSVQMEVMSRDQLQLIVPIFVAILVWLTRILFIGSLSVAGEQLLMLDGQPEPVQLRPQPVAPMPPPPAMNQPRPVAPALQASAPPVTPVLPRQTAQPPQPGRVRQRPPLAGSPMGAASQNSPFNTKTQR